MGAVLTKVLRHYDLKLFSGSFLAFVIVASQRQRLLTGALSAQTTIEKQIPFVLSLRVALQRIAASWPPKPSEIARWDTVTCLALAVPVVAMLYHSATPSLPDEAEKEFIKRESAKRIGDLRQLALLSFKENEEILSGLLELRDQDTDNEEFCVSKHPQWNKQWELACRVEEEQGCDKPPDCRPLEDRLRCTTIVSQTHMADECMPNDPSISHALLVAAAALCYELRYVHRETLRWYPELWTSQGADESGLGKEDGQVAKMEKYRTGSELKSLVEGTAEGLADMMRDHSPSSSAAFGQTGPSCPSSAEDEGSSATVRKAALAQALEMVRHHEAVAFRLFRVLEQRKLWKGLRLLNSCTPQAG
jgi:hypothetical protein